jgi:hypothetical protein
LQRAAYVGILNLNMVRQAGVGSTSANASSR